MQTPFKKFRKILTAMLKITYAPCGYVNVLSFSLAHWARGWQDYFLCVLRIVMTLKILILVHSLSRAHTHDLLPLTGKKIFFVLRMLAMPFQVIQCSTSERCHVHSPMNCSFSPVMLTHCPSAALWHHR